MREVLEGRVWVFGDDISTDHIIAGKYLGTTDPKVFAAHAMENVRPDWAKQVQADDILVAGDNFGCGSSREQAPLALRSLGITAIVANSFARIFYRNAINLALPVVECRDLVKHVKEGETLSVDLTKGEVRTAAGQRFSTLPYPPHIVAILRAGGLVPKLRAEIAGRPRL